MKYHGYPAIKYKIATSDSYLLTMHRIPGGANQPLVPSLIESWDKTTILIVHGILSDAMSFVINGPNEPNKAIPY